MNSLSTSRLLSIKLAPRRPRERHAGTALRATAPGTEVRPSIDTSSISRLLPPYAVILHDDDYNEMGYVVESLVICVPEIQPEQAVEIMLEAHLNGKAHVIACPLERAELYRDRLESRGLTATIEKA